MQRSRELEDTAYLVARKVANFVAEIDVMHLQDDTWIVTRLAVPKSFRNQGIGTELAKELIRWADSKGYILEAYVLGATEPVAHVDSDGIKRFLQRFGFVCTDLPGQMVRKPCLNA